MTRYVGILDHSNGTWGVRVPDLPGCYGAGDSHEEAMADATSAVREWIAHQRTRGVKLPAARDVEAVLADPGSEFNSENEALVVISLERRKPRPPKGKPSKARVSARAA